MSEHAWHVRHVVPNAPIGPSRYLPACACGWAGAPQTDELDAVVSAYRHALGHPPELVAKPPKPADRQTSLLPRRPTKPRPQTDALFDGGDYER